MWLHFWKYQLFDGMHLKERQRLRRWSFFCIIKLFEILISLISKQVKRKEVLFKMDCEISQAILRNKWFNGIHLHIHLEIIEYSDLQTCIA